MTDTNRPSYGAFGEIIIWTKLQLSRCGIVFNIVLNSTAMYQNLIVRMYENIHFARGNIEITWRLTIYDRNKAYTFCVVDVVGEKLNLFKYLSFFDNDMT